LGTWLLLGQAGVIVSFLDFGLTNVIIRRIAFASVARESDGPNGRDQRLAELIAAAKVLCRTAAVFAFALSFGAGWWLLARIGLEASLVSQARMTWGILCIGYAITISGGLWSASVWGLGHMTAASVVTTVCGLATLGSQVVAVLLGGGMETLALVMLAGCMAQRWATLRLLRRRAPALLSIRVKAHWVVMVELAVPSLQYWLTEIGALMLLRTDQIFIAGLHETSRIPAYYAAYSLLYNMAMVAMALGDVSCVQISKLWREGAIGAARAMVVSNARIALTLMACGAATMALIGDAVITVWLGPGHFIGDAVLLVFCLMLVLFVQQSIMFGFSRATEHEAFAVCYLLAGALNLVLTWVLAQRYNLFGVALATLIAQLLTTNWFVPNLALRRFHISWRRYAAEVVLPAGAVAGFTALAVWFATFSIPADHAVARLVVGAFVGTAAMLSGFWTLIIGQAGRSQVRGAINRLSECRRFNRRSSQISKGTTTHSVASTND